jgi:hypothetical protein
MAANIKTTFIEALRTTPEGILDFLATPIPTPPTVATPADVDAAIIANGICAQYILDLFQPFAGLTPIELMLRIGQHNNVLEAGLLAGLEYIGETETQQDLEIIAPQSGASLLPGKVRCKAQAKNGTLKRCGVMIGSTGVENNTPDGLFECEISLETEGEYTATFTGIFGEKNVPQTATVSFTIAAVATDPPGGKDQSALNNAKQANDATYAAMCATMANSTDREAWNQAYQAWKAKIDALVVTAKANLGARATALDGDLSRLAQARADVATAIVDDTIPLDAAINAVGALQSVLSHIVAITSTLGS